MVIDPDIFAAADIWECSAAICRARPSCAACAPGPRLVTGCMASSVMLLDCARSSPLGRRKKFEAMFDFTQDYQP